MGASRRNRGLLSVSCVCLLVSGCATTLGQSTPGTPDIFEPNLTDGKATVTLPGEASSALAAGGGRYLVVNMKKIESLAVVDLCAAKVSKVLALPKGETAVAAGLTKVFVASNDSDTLTRYDLVTMEKELTARVPEGGIQWMGMGCGATGPLVAANRKKTLMIDPVTMQQTSVTWEHFATPDSNWNAPSMRLSGDGRTLVGWGGGWAGLEVLTIDGTRVLDRQSGGYIHGENPRLSFDGVLVFADSKALDNHLRPTDVELDGAGIPSQNANYFLALKKSGDQTYLNVFLRGSPRSIWTLKNAGELNKSSLPQEERLFFVPAANLLVALGAGDNQVLLRHFNVVEALHDAGIDYLFVSSNPVVEAPRGGTYKYLLKVESKRGTVECTLASGPEGMRVSRAGEVEWAVPAGFQGTEARVTIAVTDATRQVVYQSFVVRVSGPEPKPAATGRG